MAGTMSAVSALNTAKAALRRAASIRERAETVVGEVVEAVEVSAGAFGAGLVRGRWGAVEFLGGIPVDLGAGLLLHGIGFLGVAGKHAEHAHNFGNGCLASYAATQGAALGVRMLQQAPAPQQLAAPRTSGLIGADPGGLTPSELGQLVDAAQ